MSLVERRFQAHATGRSGSFIQCWAWEWQRASRTPVELVQQQLAGVQQGLADARASVGQRLAAVAQAQQQLVAAQRALASALLNGAPAGVLQQLGAAVVAAQQQVAAAQQALAATLALIDQLQAASGELQQELNQAQAAAS